MQRKLFLILLFLCVSIIGYSRSITICNRSNVPIEVIIWKDSRIIHHHVMPVGNELTINIGYGLLLQFRVNGIKYTDARSTMCSHARLLDDGWVEVKLDSEHFAQHEKWYTHIEKFSIWININEPKA